MGGSMTTREFLLNGVITETLDSTDEFGRLAYILKQVIQNTS